MPSPAMRYGAIDLSVITERLDAHNQGIGLGATLTRLIGGMVHQLWEQPPQPQVPRQRLLTESLRKESLQRESSRGACEADIAPTLEAIGLKVGPIRSGWQFYGAGRDFDSRLLSLHIEDAERFSTYLEALDTNSITDSQKRGLRALCLTLCQQLTTEYDLSSSDDRLLGLVSAARSMVEHYDRLDLPTERLKTYLEAIRGRYLKTYVELEQLQLDRPREKGDGYSLLWHRDTVPDRLQERWNKVIEVLTTLKENEKARHIYDTACHRARTAVEKSIGEVSQWAPSAGAIYTERKVPFLRILKAAKSRLSEL